MFEDMVQNERKFENYAKPPKSKPTAPGEGGAGGHKIKGNSRIMLERTKT